MIFSSLIFISVLGAFYSLFRHIDKYSNYAKSYGVFAPLLLSLFFFIVVLPLLKKRYSNQKVNKITLVFSAFFLVSFVVGIFATKILKENDPIIKLSKKIEKNGPSAISKKELEKANIYVNAKSDYSLHEIIKRGAQEKKEILFAIIQKSDRIYINKIYRGDTPLTLAVRLQENEAVQLLLMNKYIDVTQKVWRTRYLQHVNALQLANELRNSVAFELIAEHAKAKKIPIT